MALDAGSREPLNRSQVVKQYGRRLVLSFEAPASNEVMWQYYDGVQDIELDVLVSTSEVQGSRDSIEWQFAADSPYGLQVQKVWPFTNGSLQTRIAVLDSGIASTARDAFVNLEQGYDFVSDPEYALDGDGPDPNSEDPGDASPSCPDPSWHGTKMAFAIAGKHSEGLHSVAWNTTIQPLRVLGLCSTGFANDVTDAIVWAAGGLIGGLGVNPQPAKIISMSFGGQGKCPSYLQSAISMAVNQFKVTVLAAAGNQGSSVSDFFPANCGGVISVGASTRYGHLAPYSNTGPSVLAAGGDVLDPIKTWGGGSSWGTSFSTSFAAGVISLTNHSWRQLVKSPSNDSVCMTSNYCGAGIISAEGVPYSQEFNETTEFTETSGNPRVQAQACSQGNWAAAGSTVCYGCPSGKYSTVVGATSETALNCQTCPTGTQSAVGSSLCSGCVPLTQSATSFGAYNDVPGYYVHRFTSSTAYSLQFNRDTIADVLLIGGGGGSVKGGGGAGAVIYSSQYLFKTGKTYTLTVGSGGTSSTNPAGDSSIYDGGTALFVAKGGGPGGSYSCTDTSYKGKTGGSGGGGGAGECTTGVNAGGTASSANTNFALSGYSGGNIGGNGKRDPELNCRKGGGGGGSGTKGSDGCCACVGYGGDGIYQIAWQGQTLSFQALFGNAYTQVAVQDTTDNNFYVAGGGGGGGTRESGLSTITVTGGKGGGGNGYYHYSGSTKYGGQGKDGTGSGSGGSTGGGTYFVRGGHGSVFIRYSKCQSCSAGTYLSAPGVCSKCTPGKFSGYGQTTCQNCPTNSASVEGSSSCNGLQGYSLYFVGATTTTASSSIAVTFPSHVLYFSTTTTPFYGIQYTTYAYIKSGSGTILIPPLWPAQSTTGLTVYKTTSLSFAACTGTCSGGQPHCAVGGASKICCGPGYVFRDGVDTACQMCPANTFSSTGAATTCTSCSGTLFSSAGASVCIDCTTTTTCTASQTKRCVNTASNVCCSAGQYFRQGIDATCQSCPSGTYSLSGAAQECLSCSAGSYSSSTKTTACTLCGPGKYQDQSGQQACVSCYAGSYQSSAGQDNCVECDPGTYSTALGAATLSSCTSCQRGSFQAYGGSTKCELCDAGSYQSSTRQVECTLCPKGSYSAALGVQDACQLCSAGKFQDALGRTVCSECLPGTSQQGTGASDCTTCAPGSFAAIGLFTALHNTCGESMAQFCMASSDAINAVDLAVDGNNSTYAVALNDSWLEIDLERPKAIMGGSIVTPNLRPFEIWTGNSGASFNDTGNSRCLVAGATFACSAVAEFLFVVALNEFWIQEIEIWGLLNYTGASACRECAVGSYQPSSGSFSCTECPRGTNASSGSSQNCTVSPGFYGTPGYAANECPENYYCPAGSLIQCPALFGSKALSKSLADCVTLEVEFEIKDAPIGLNLSDNNAVTTVLSENVSITPCMAGFYCPEDSTNPVACPALTDSPQMSTSLADCRRGCPDGTVASASNQCLECEGGYWCKDGIASTCPLHSFSSRGSKNIHDCRCQAGYFCLYTKSVAAVVVLENVTATMFNNDWDGVRTAFVKAIAKAAGVDPSKVQVVRVTGPARRRLMASPTELRIELVIWEEKRSNHLLSASKPRNMGPIRIEEWKVKHDLKVSKMPLRN